MDQDSPWEGSPWFTSGGHDAKATSNADRGDRSFKDPSKISSAAKRRLQHPATQNWDPLIYYDFTGS